ncbi:MAG: peptidase U32 family protein [archaeon]
MAEIMAPAGSKEALHAAIKAGADSVYFGVGKLNMRASAANFTLDNLEETVNYCKEKNVKTYLTVNIVMYDEDLEYMRTVIDKAKKVGVTAVICTDFAAIQYANSIRQRVHLSTQANVSNLEAVKYYSQFADAIVLARELRLEQIKNICNEIKKQQIKSPSGELVKIEAFIHGALCVSVSGKCYMSLATYNKSANRGSCLQNCRRGYKVTDEETGDELVIDNKYVMSPSDLCTIRILDRLVDSGVDIMKIEGRGRKPDYVYTVVKVYKEAVEAVEDNSYTKEKVESWEKELAKVYNRGFWHNGYYLGEKINEWSGEYGSKATTEKSYTAKGINYYPKSKVALFLVESGELKIGDKIAITGPTTGYIEHKIETMIIEGEEATTAKKGEEVTFPLECKVRHNDKLFVIKKRN